MNRCSNSIIIKKYELKQDTIFPLWEVKWLKTWVIPCLDMKYGRKRHSHKSSITSSIIQSPDRKQRAHSNWIIWRAFNKKIIPKGVGSIVGTQKGQGGPRAGEKQNDRAEQRGSPTRMVILAPGWQPVLSNPTGRAANSLSSFLPPAGAPTTTTINPALAQARRQGTGPDLPKSASQSTKQGVKHRGRIQGGNRRYPVWKC